LWRAARWCVSVQQFLVDAVNAFKAAKVRLFAPALIWGFGGGG
jgi:hypothetical protein